MELYPLQLKGITKSPIWGGTRLLEGWKKSASAATVGESWELTVREHEMCTVTNGIYAGRTLGELLAKLPREMMGRTHGSAEQFPLLVKLIDAADRLSVQVHPDDSYAERVENDRGKTEMWYIVEADRGAEIVCGLLDGVSAEDYAAAVKKGDYESLLKRQPVQAGETYFIPAGLPHAIGKGILIAEIQQNCDLTYRVYDYHRRDAAGNLRELHVEKALDVIRPFTKEELEEVRFSRLHARASSSILADCSYFRVEKVSPAGVSVLTPSPYLRHLLCLSGDGELKCGDRHFRIRKGDSYLLPATLPAVTVQGATCLLSTAY